MQAIKDYLELVDRRAMENGGILRFADALLLTVVLVTVLGLTVLPLIIKFG